MPKVLIINSNKEYSSMFTSLGWTITTSLEEANLVQFTGGADLSPHHYGQPSHSKTFASPNRDDREILAFKMALFEDKPIAGICRGGQFVNVMCGGELWQDVDGHAGVPHECLDLKTNESFEATSTHHQMMIPTEKAEIIVVANKASFYEKMIMKGNLPRVLRVEPKDPWQDIEAVYYSDYNAFCFQPHPEFTNREELAERYMNYLETYILKGA